MRCKEFLSYLHSYSSFKFPPFLVGGGRGGAQGFVVFYPGWMEYTNSVLLGNLTFSSKNHWNSDFKKYTIVHFAILTTPVSIVT